MKRANRFLLRLYPYDFRAAFTVEMSAILDENGRFPELTGIAIGCIHEWFAKWTTDKFLRGRALPDIRMMRPAGIAKEVWFARCSPDI